MSCSSYDWKAYALGELDQNNRRQAEAHAVTCSSCREELAGLRLTLDAMSTLREEEIPKRIAFVSDKVFEPRWWQIFRSPAFAGRGDSGACTGSAAGGSRRLAGADRFGRNQGGLGYRGSPCPAASGSAREL